MPKSLLIVESPTKAKTLGRYLGKDFMVKASVGHVKDLPKNKLGIDVEHGFSPEYEVIRGKKKIVSELKEAAAKADAIYLGPDPDREGEAIAWHIADEIRSDGKPIHRVLFYELTHKAILKALAEPSELNHSLFEAQQARRILDRLVGYLISPLLWEKVRRGLSAGRVQSVTLRLICQRESEIERFEPTEYWTIEGAFQTSGDGENGLEGLPPRTSFTARLWRCKGEDCTISAGDEANRLSEIFRTSPFEVSKVERKTRRRNPAPPFITSTLQQEAARKLRYSAKRTMSIAQRLYEGMEIGDEGAVGLITYMRTDSTRLSEEAVEAARQFIGTGFGPDYLPAKPLVYKSRKGAQDAHEAIRPTDVQRTPEAMARYLTKEQLNLYTIIWKRFVACQMAPAILVQTAVEVSSGDYVFRASGSVTQFAGFTVLYVEGRDDANGPDSEAEGTLPELQKGQGLSCLEVNPNQHFTQPPPRFSEASLIKELEELGIGRPSTYATIVSTILDREYVTVDKQRLYPTELGRLVDDLLLQNFPQILDVEFTASMEKSLDEIENGRDVYQDVISGFYEGFQPTVDSAQARMRNVKALGLPTHLECPRCQQPLHIRWSRNGPFIACSRYPECDFSSDFERDEKGAVRLVSKKESGEVCDKCGSPMVMKKGRFGPFLACSAYPKCKNTRPVTSGIPCPRDGCGGLLVERVTKHGRRFWGCNKYPECKIAVWGKPVQKPCPLCGGSLLMERESKRGGLRRSCINPECRYEERGEPETEPATTD